MPQTLTFEGKDILAVAQAHVGEDYILGARAPLTHSNWHGPWDCAEYASWCAYQSYRIVFGCQPKDPRRADAFTGYWYDDARANDVLIEVQQALSTPGAFLLRRPRFNPGGSTRRVGHIGISDGQGGLYEAKSRSAGVVYSDNAAQRNWDGGVLLPGVLYVKNAPVLLQRPELIYRLENPFQRGDEVLQIQQALADAGFHPGPVDGIFGELTEAAVIAFQTTAGLVIDGEVGPETAAALGLSVFEVLPVPDAPLPAPADSLAAPAYELIVSHETGGPAFYERFAKRPIWPGHSSGLTIGFGWDCGYNSHNTFKREWGSVLSDAQFDALLPAIGLRATSPNRPDKVAKLKKLKTANSWIEIPWDKAKHVFDNDTLPLWIGKTRNTFPGSDALPPLCFGVLVSLVFNRGTSMRDSDRRREMRAIRELVRQNQLAGVPAQIRSMKRLWDPSSGLIRRREEEAQLFQQGLA